MFALERAAPPFRGVKKQVFSSTDGLRRSTYMEGEIR